MIEIIHAHSHSRKQIVPTTSEIGYGFAAGGVPLEVNVGGATIFVVDVEQFLRV